MRTVRPRYTRKQQNTVTFRLFGGSNGTYAFKIGFYGLTTMPSEFQKLKDNLFHNLKKHVYTSDDISIVTRESKEDHLKTVEVTFQVLDEAGIRLKTEKCSIAKTQLE